MVYILVESTEVVDEGSSILKGRWPYLKFGQGKLPGVAIIAHKNGGPLSEPPACVPYSMVSA